MSTKFKIAIAGATGNVGREIIQILEDKEFPIDQLYLLASSRSKGQAIEFKVNIDSKGGSSTQAKGAADKSSRGYAGVEDARHVPLHPKSLLTLLSNPNFSKLSFIHKIRAAALVDWIKTVAPSKTMLSSFFYSAKSIDTPSVKRQLKNNGFRYSSKNTDLAGGSVDSTIKDALSVLLKNLEELPPIMSEKDLQ